MNISGKKFAVQFGMAKAVLYFDSTESLTFTIFEKDGVKTDVSETVAIRFHELRPNLNLVTLQEKAGTTVSQVHDLEKGIIYSNWTTLDGDFKNIEGTINEIGA